MSEALLNATPAPHILVVDDTPVNVLVVTSFLELWGMRYDVAENGQQSIEKFSVTQYDLILMDLQMPVMDGYQAALAIREREIEQRRGHTPIIALSAHVMRSERDRCFDFGMDDFLPKPYLGEELHETILRHLSVVAEGRAAERHL